MRSDFIRKKGSGFAEEVTVFIHFGQKDIWSWIPRYQFSLVRSGFRGFLIPSMVRIFCYNPEIHFIPKFRSQILVCTKSEFYQYRLCTDYCLYLVCTDSIWTVQTLYRPTSVFFHVQTKVCTIFFKETDLSLCEICTCTDSEQLW